jgi:hypothetical protein
MKYLLIFFFIMLSFQRSSAQKRLTQQQRDSIAFVDSIRAELAILFGLDSLNLNYSYTDINVGMGNGFFSPKKSTLAGLQTKTYYSAGGGYYHKSGANISLQSSFIPDKGNFTLYQTVLSPGYNYTRSRKIGFGVAYFHYFMNDSVSFTTSPLVDEFYGYIKYKGGWLVPKLGVDYAFGKEVLRPRPNFPNYTVTNSANDLTLFGSVDHTFDFDNIFSKSDYFIFSPNLTLIAGTSNYGTNVNFGQVVRNASLINRIQQTRSQKASTGFILQSLSLSLNSEYSLSAVYIQPQFLINYTLPKAQSQFNFIYNLAIGMSF